MKEYYEQQGKDPFDVIPLTFVINDGLNDPEFDKFEEVFSEYESRLQTVWIIKPGEHSNRGCGIYVTKSLKEIKDLVRQKSSDLNRTAIIQKYIE